MAPACKEVLSRNVKIVFIIINNTKNTSVYSWMEKVSKKRDQNASNVIFRKYDCRVFLFSLLSTLSLFWNPACKFFSFLNIIHKQRTQIYPWSNKENKLLALLLWLPPPIQTLSFDPKREDYRFFNFLLMEPFPWEVHITTKISWWEKNSSDLTVLSILQQISQCF